MNEYGRILAIAFPALICASAALAGASSGNSVPEDWLAQAQLQIVDQEYDVRWSRRMVLAGIDRVVPRQEDEPSWE